MVNTRRSLCWLKLNPIHLCNKRRDLFILSDCDLSTNVPFDSAAHSCRPSQSFPEHCTPVGVIVPHVGLLKNYLNPHRIAEHRGAELVIAAGARMKRTLFYLSALTNITPHRVLGVFFLSLCRHIKTQHLIW